MQKFSNAGSFDFLTPTVAMFVGRRAEWLIYVN
jgi:hypothetical protein